MNLSALLTSAGINTAVCVVLFSLYSILRKQISFVNVYFGQKVAQARFEKNQEPFRFDRFIPSASWLIKCWGASEDELCSAGGLDAVVFLRIVAFSMRIFSIAAIICLFLVLPLNYFGQEMQHKHLSDESLGVFTTENVKQGSQWLWAHCIALYVISCSACILLYHEYKSITKKRLAYITTSHWNLSHFTVLVRGVPYTTEDSCSNSVAKYFTNYYSASYLSHQMVYRSGTLQKLMSDAEKMYNILKSLPKQPIRPSFMRCGLCGGTTTSFKYLTSSTQDEDDNNNSKPSDFNGLDLTKREVPAAFVFFRTRYAAFIASQALQSPNPMLWVTDPAPEPRDIYWSNLWVPYKILWIRRISILIGSVCFVGFFLLPVTITQGLVHLDKLQKTFPFMKEVLERKYMAQFVTGYLPSFILMLFMYIVPPLMTFFSTLQGPISRSHRKRSACIKVLYFGIWNVFFGNILSGSVFERLGTNPREIPQQLGRAVPATATFFMTYVMTSGWSSLAVELLQPFGLLRNLFFRIFLRNTDESSYGTLTFPYHTEVPRVLLFGLLGFTCSIFAPLILPFLLVYFLLAYIVYRNQLLNVYETKYESGGLYWPIVHNTTIFSLIVAQLIALGVFTLKKSTLASSFTIPLIICTVLFNEYCRQRFHPIFQTQSAQVLIDMDREDEEKERLQEIHQKLPLAYCQFASSFALGKPVGLDTCLDQTVINFNHVEEDLHNKSPVGQSPVRPRLLPLEIDQRSPRGPGTGPTPVEIEELQGEGGGKKESTRGMGEIPSLGMSHSFISRACRRNSTSHGCL